MIFPQILVKTTAAANARVSATVLCVTRAIFKSRGNNTGGAVIRIGLPAFVPLPEPGAFTPPTDPLTASTQNTLILIPGESFTFEVSAGEIERGQFLDLNQFYYNGDNGTDILEVIYNFAPAINL